MSGFNTKERNNNGEYEITFYTESRQDFEKVQDLCRELIGHNKPASIKGDLISRSDFKNKFISTISVGRLEFEDIINLINNVPSVEQEVYMHGEDYNFFIRGYKEGRKDFEKPQSEWVTDELCRLRSCLRSGTHVGSYLQTPAQIDRFIKALDEVIKHD